MPEAPVEEHRNLGLGEDEVGRPSYLLKGADADSVAKAQSVNSRPERNLRFRVAPLIRLHACADTRRGSPRLDHRCSIETARRHGVVGGSE